MGASFVAHVLFLLCFFATTFSFFLKAESNVSCNEKDKQALLNFKQGLSDPFGVLSSWSDQEDCSTWDEVVYDNKTGQVTKLHLNYWGFGGEISGSLLQLEHLNYLDLSGNDFNRTPIPTFLGSMASLTHLDLRWSNFSGHIPHQLGHLSNLRYLDLAGKIPEKIGIMKKLESIDLSQNHLSGEIPLNLSSLTFLSHLNLSYNNLSGKIPLGTQLQTFDALSYIGNPQLCGNPLPRNCIIREESQNRTSIGKTEEDSNNYNFYIGMGVGFAVGFWAICGVLFFNWNWRHAYFRFLDDMKDWVYVTTVLNVNWLLEKLRSCHL
ncbi:receptor-like protein EIX2 isoform X4 [Quercus suber]|uniref:receptor-like protein EIX2 isoform X4 n=1 Tax=Quercus suber TaxID=58331 RepID=UPI0032DE3240